MLHVRLSISVCVCVFLSVCVYFKICVAHTSSIIYLHGPCIFICLA